MGRQSVAVVGDIHNCPIHGVNTIAAGGVRPVDGKPIARLGDPCDCGGVIMEGSPRMKDQGNPVAYHGAKTSCGGTIEVTQARMKVPT